MASRFDYVKYDEASAGKQAALKSAAQDVEKALEEVEAARLRMMDLIVVMGGTEMQRDRAGEKLAEATGPDIDDALTLLEESYMWCGKAIRDEQIVRNGGAELQEGRTDG